MIFLRRFDDLAVSQAHIYSFYTRYDINTDTVLIGHNISHYFYDQQYGVFYDHDSSNGHYGSKQDLLGKSKVYSELYGKNQEIHTKFDINNFHFSYFQDEDVIIQPDHPKRELVDWLSPGWFALGVGDVIFDIDTETYPDFDVIYLTNSEMLKHFEHECWGAPANQMPCDGPKEPEPGDPDPDDIRSITYAMVLPDDLEGMVLSGCKGSPKYEILKVIGISNEPPALAVKRAQLNTSPIEILPGQEVRAMLWGNPNNWGARAFFMNPTTGAPTAKFFSENNLPERLPEHAARWVKYHILPSRFTVEIASGSYDVYFPDGFWLDAYQQDGLTPKVTLPQMFLHAEDIDLNLDNNPDCGEFGDPGDCDETVKESWRDGYEAFLSAVNGYIDDVRLGEEEYLSIVPNGHPHESIYTYINGRYWEDMNGGFMDQNIQQILRRCYSYWESEVSGEMEVPTQALFLERDKDVNPLSETNLPQMRLTLAISLIASNSGSMGVRGHDITSSTRTPLYASLYNLEEGEEVTIEDFYDEHAVDYWGRGCRNSAFPIEDEDAVRDARHYLGQPLVTDPFPDQLPNELPFPKWYRGHWDIVYREYDHGLVIAHLGICETQRDVYDVNLNDIDILEDPRESLACPGNCHWMKIQGSEDPTYNDDTNTGEHDVETILVDDWHDDDVYGRGDAIIILKEGDGFGVHPDPDH